MGRDEGQMLTFIVLWKLKRMELMRVNYYVIAFLGLLVSSSLSLMYGQGSSSLQVGISFVTNDDKFCDGISESFVMQANVSGGTAPYEYSWTFEWNNETLTNELAAFQTSESGWVYLRVSDSSHPRKSKKDSVFIEEVIISADFTFDQDNACAETPIHFFSEASGGDNYIYYWNFGDSQSSEKENPVHQFTSPGCSGTTTFNVYMNVEDESGCASSVTKEIHVKNKPNLVFEDLANPFTQFKHCHSENEDPEFQVLLNNLTEDTICISNYHIDWGDGSSSDTTAFPIPHTYTEVGAFELLVTATNSSGCDVSWSKIIYNQSTPAGGVATEGGAVGCAPIEFWFTLFNYELNSVGTTYTWDFGDESPPIVWDHDDPFNVDSIAHMYEESSCVLSPDGYYTVHVLINNGCGEVEGTVSGVKVNIQPEAAIDDGLYSIDSICTNESITLYNNTEGGHSGSACDGSDQYLWDFGDGTTSDSDEATMVVSWDQPGDYDVVLDVGNICGSTRDTFSIVVLDPPDIDISVDDTSGCIPYTPTITNNTTGTDYFWEVEPSNGVNFLNGTDSTSMVPDLEFTESGIYALTLFASNACRTESQEIELNVLAPPGGSITNLEDVCITDPVIHPGVNASDNGSAISSYFWTFIGSTVTLAIDSDPGEHTYTNPGSHVVSLRMSNACGPVTITDTFDIVNSPQIFTNSPASICQDNFLQITGSTVDEASSFEWRTEGDGVFSDPTFLNPTYTPGTNDISNSGTSLYLLAEGNAPCASDSSEISLFIQQQPKVIVDNNVSICEGSSYQVKDAQVTNYTSLEWSSTGDGFFSNPNSLRPIYIPGSQDRLDGSVSLMLTATGVDPCNTTRSGAFSITYVNNPNITAGIDRDICEDGQVSLSAIGSDYGTLFWDVVDGDGSFNNPSIISPIFTLDPLNTESTVILRVEASGLHGCSNVSDEIELSVVPKPIIDPGADAEICQDSTYTHSGASASQVSSYYWTSDGDGTINFDHTLTPQYTPGTSDISVGQVNLNLIGVGNSVCADTSAPISLHIQQFPEAFAGDDADICISDNYLTGGSVLNSDAYYWSTTGSGNFADETSLATTYTPSENDRNNGNVELILWAAALDPCTNTDADTLVLTFIDLPEVDAGPDSSICAADFTPIHASYSNATSLLWRSNGTGTWINETSLTPTYSPSASDISNGSVTLTLEASNPTCPPITSTMVLQFTPPPTAYAGLDDIICEDATKTLDDAIGNNYSLIEWTSSGDGSFIDPNILNTVYIPGTDDIENEQVSLYLNVTGMEPCSNIAVDTIELDIQRNPVVFAGNDTVVGEGENNIIITATAEHYNNLFWKTLGDGSFTYVSPTEYAYSPGTSDLANRGVNLVLTATSHYPCIKVARDTLFIQITPLPVADAGGDEATCEGAPVLITTADSSETSEIWWTSLGTGVIQDSTTLTPTYVPSPEDIANRSVALILHARGNYPIEHYVDTDTMMVHIIHNAEVISLRRDTACENMDYLLHDVQYFDENSISWTSSGSGIFTDPSLDNPQYIFSEADKNLDSIYLYVEVSSIAPCIARAGDTMLLRIFHEPALAFSADTSEGCGPLIVNFTNSSIGEELSFNWDFGNFQSSDEKNPSNIIFEQGIIADTTYTIELTASNRCNSHSTTKEVVVKPIPVTNFGMDMAWGCTPMEIQFFNVTTGLPESFLWNWGDATSESTEQNPGSHIFITGDIDTTYIIKLITENECGADSLEKSVRIFPNSVTAFFETDTNFGCAPLEVRFTNYSRGVIGDEPFLNWSWNFGDGEISDEHDPVHTFDKPGQYQVTLYVNDTCGHGTFTTQISVLAAPEVDFITDKSEYCEHDTVYFIPQNMLLDYLAGVHWDFGDSSDGSSFNEQHKYDMDGVFTVTLTGKDIFTGCTSSLSKNVIIHDAPEADFSVPANDGCEPLSITFSNSSKGADYYSWDFGNGNVSIEENGTQVYRDSGVYTITLQALDDEGCSDTIIKSIKVNPKPLADFTSSSTSTCFPPIDVLYTNLSEGATDYQWDLGNGIQSKETNATTRYIDYGSYPVSLIVRNIYHCADTSEITYNVYHNPIADFSVDTTIGCDPFTVPFTNHSTYGTEYMWTFGEQGQSSDEDPVFTFHGQGVYTVKLHVTGAGDCTDSIIFEDYIITNPSPVAEFDYSRIDGIDTVQFHNYSRGAESYSWDFGDGNGSEDENPWHSYGYYGMFNVILTAANEYQCTSIYTDSINFELFKGLFMPNAFTPGDQNEKVNIFKPAGVGLIKYHLVVYDTWGNLIWETKKLEHGVPSEGWDGTKDGRLLDPDVYVWHLKEATFKDGSNYKGERYGTITLIR